MQPPRKDDNVIPTDPPPPPPKKLQTDPHSVHPSFIPPGELPPAPPPKKLWRIPVIMLLTGVLFWRIWPYVAPHFGR